MSASIASLHAARGQGKPRGSAAAEFRENRQVIRTDGAEDPEIPELHGVRPEDVVDNWREIAAVLEGSLGVQSYRLR